MSAQTVITLLLLFFCSANEFSLLPKAENFVSTNVIRTIYNTPEQRAAKCREWYENDQGVDHLNLPPCPLTEQLAMADKDFAEDKSPPHLHHPGADRCYRSAGFWWTVWRWARTWNDPGGQQCCYKSNELVIVGSGAGSADRGAFLWNHWWHDVLPSYYCCMDGDAAVCDLYHKRRPTDTGHGYGPTNGKVTG
uniref:AMOP domain-containing protein n=1 Tax=Globodera rostochiensis TaxID=31243 RepID=A0A914H2I2_GLORO